jgi:molybdopterin-guanine dinucleotide biosynthesis protein A
MTTKENHHKHPPMVKPSIGYYHRCEWGIYGTACDKVKELYEQLAVGLREEASVAYVDADHGDPSNNCSIQVGIKRFHTPDRAYWNEYDDKVCLTSADAVIVNGNHYPAHRQIVVIDPKKKDSLFKRINQLTRVDLVLYLRDKESVYDFVQERIHDQTILLHIEDHEGICKYINDKITSARPSLKALVLAGGKSLRMGKDKSQMNYHGKSQQLHVADMCKSLGLDTYISKSFRAEEASIDGYEVIKDRIIDMGPFGGIWSAMMKDPDSAWMVVACDLPFLDQQLLIHLIHSRDPRYVATAFKGKTKDFPEPLITIYEPKAFQKFLQFLSLGFSCPRKVLINSDIKTVLLEDEQAIINVNTQEDHQNVIERINNK